MLELLRNCYQNDINFGKYTAYLRNIKENEGKESFSCLIYS